jgi:fibronectin type 3 domain-containing protein
MAIPSTPTNLLLQQANGQVYLSFDISAGATTYGILRSTDNVTFASVATPATNYYTDTSVTTGVNYFYRVTAINGDGTSGPTDSQSIVPTPTGVLTLGQVRLQAQQRADMVNSQFVTIPEWNQYISASYQELYDLLVNTYEDWFLAAPYNVITDGINSQYPVPNGVLTDAISGLPAAPFYKLLGVDLGLANNNNAWVTIHKFDFIERNRYVYPNITSTFAGVFNMRYRVMGSNLKLIPTPSAGQYLRLHYVPRLELPLADNDLMDGVNGWLEYVVIDAAIKAMQKEESDVTVLAMQKAAIIKRIEESAINRDIGQPDTISKTRGTWSGGYGGPGWDGGYGGY